MTPPEAGSTGSNAGAPETPPAVSLCPAPAPSPLETLRHRPDFLRAASARRQGTGSFLLQARDRKDGQPARRVGFTASKKIGNAVLRNRAKRRMRALAREVLAGAALPGWDYVLVARPEATVERPYSQMRADLLVALASVHREGAK